MATIGAYPGCVCRAGTYAIGIVLSLNSFAQKEYHLRTNPFDICKCVRRRKRAYNPQGGSLFACVITQGSLLSSATLGYRKYNRDAVVFHPLPAHRNGWDGRGEGLPAFPIGWNGRTKCLPIYPNGWNVWADRLPHAICDVVGAPHMVFLNPIGVVLSIAQGWRAQ